MLGRFLLALAALWVCTDISQAHAPTIDRNPHERATSQARDGARTTQGRVQRGKVSWYGPGFAGHKTASGERFDPHALTMAHRTLPLGAIVDVTNNANGRQVRVRVNDRGPFHGNRVADLSRAASQRLGFVDKGITDATISVVSLPQDVPAS